MEISVEDVEIFEKYVFNNSTTDDNKISMIQRFNNGFYNNSLQGFLIKLEGLGQLQKTAWSALSGLHFTKFEEDHLTLTVKDKNKISTRLVKDREVIDLDEEFIIPAKPFRTVRVLTLAKAENFFRRNLEKDKAGYLIFNFLKVGKKLWPDLRMLLKSNFIDSNKIQEQLTNFYDGSSVKYGWIGQYDKSVNGDALLWIENTQNWNGVDIPLGIREYRS